MVQYSDYKNILLSTNWVGGAGQSDISTAASSFGANATGNGDEINFTAMKEAA